MSKEIDKLKNEIRADLALMWGSHSASNSRIGEMSRSLEAQAEMIAEQGQRIAEQGQQIAEQGQRIAAQGERIAEQGRQIATSMRQSAALGREIIAQGDQMAGRFRQFDQRFGQLLGALEKDGDRRFRALEKRVERLENKGDPAA